MKFIQALCESVTRALGLSTLSGYDDQTSLHKPVDAVGSARHPVNHIKGHHVLKGKAQQTSAPKARLAGPSESLHTLFPDRSHSETLNSLFPDRSRKISGPHGGQREDEVSLQREKLPGFPHEPEDESTLPPGPKFKPPNATPGFYCDYSAMRGWRHAAGGASKTAWLEKPIMDSDTTGGVYNIFTNYDQYAPIGTTRKYHLTVDEHNINADGMARPDGGKAFNATFPGPWLEACWGDYVEITIENRLQYNGTTIHYHGVRMLNAFEYDGVNAVSQCAIAPGDSFTYKFRVTQYGTSWYHSHYSLQYADGLFGPLTFHGPHSDNFDVALDPYLFGDWSHNSAFEDYGAELRNPPAFMRSVILNGAGFYNCTNNPNPDCKGGDKKDPPPIYEQVFEKGRKYLLRLINTSTASTFIFSIDKHMLQIIANDFVAIEPYFRDSILVGIGQRYHVIVLAQPSNDLLPPEEKNYWIRITAAAGCDDIEEGQKNDKLGIIRYDESLVGSGILPTTKRYQFDRTCADEPYESLVPVVPMTVGPAANNLDANTGDNFEVGVEVPTSKYTVPHGNFSRWDILDTPMWLNFSDPLIDHLGDKSFNNPEYALVTEDFDKEEWVYIIMTAQGTEHQKEIGKRVFVPVAHPMHLHGHDAILLAQENRPFHPDDIHNGTFKYDNPPRRDAILLPRHGYMAIAFRTDNPGQWILHCHIAWHASSGLGLNIRENESRAKLSPEVKAEKDRVCKNWRAWEMNNKNWWDPHEFQEDSGV